MAGMLFVVVLAGCGPPGLDTADVTGTLTLDGKSVDGAVLGFQGEQGPPATATTDASGAFKLAAVVGKNTVTVTKSVIVADTKPNPDVVAGPVETRLLLPSKYSVPGASGLSYDVQHGMPPVNIELQSR